MLKAGAVVVRIIPAYAGLTRWVRSAVLIDRDHPRLRGVNGDSVLIVGGHDGSSPLTRG